MPLGGWRAQSPSPELTLCHSGAVDIARNETTSSKQRFGTVVWATARRGCRSGRFFSCYLPPPFNKNCSSKNLYYKLRHSPMHNYREAVRAPTSYGNLLQRPPNPPRVTATESRFWRYEARSTPRIVRIGNHVRRPSKLTIPEKCHPLARLMFTEMKAQGVTYDELEFLSGVLRCTTKSWRFERNPKRRDDPGNARSTRLATRASAGRRSSPTRNARRVGRFRGLVRDR